MRRFVAYADGVAGPEACAVARERPSPLGRWVAREQASSVVVLPSGWFVAERWDSALGLGQPCHGAGVQREVGTWSASTRCAALYGWLSDRCSPKR